MYLEPEGDNGLCPECGVNHYAEWLGELDEEEDFAILSIGIADWDTDGGAPATDNSVGTKPSQ